MDPLRWTWSAVVPFDVGSIDVDTGTGFFRDLFEDVRANLAEKLSMRSRNIIITDYYYTLAAWGLSHRQEVTVAFEGFRLCADTTTTATTTEHL